LKLKTANYLYATTLVEFDAAVRQIGIPCVVKPLMSSSGKGQSVVKSEADIEKSWNYAMSGTRGDLMEVIVEEFIPFESEITLLTVTQKKRTNIILSTNWTSTRAWRLPRKLAASRNVK
jgi:phosphoribosylglycinamide formyltransferase 2